MGKYSLIGYYDVSTRRKEGIQGELEISITDGFLTGEFYKTPKIIKGYLNKDEDMIQLRFLQINRETGISNVVYSLQKNNDGEIRGRYIGQFGILKSELIFNKDYTLFKPSFDIFSTCGSIGYATLLLREDFSKSFQHSDDERS